MLLRLCFDFDSGLAKDQREMLFFSIHHVDDDTRWR